MKACVSVPQDHTTIHQDMSHGEYSSLRPIDKMTEGVMPRTTLLIINSINYS